VTPSASHPHPRKKKKKHGAQTTLGAVVLGLPDLNFQQRDDENGPFFFQVSLWEIQKKDQPMGIGILKK